MWLSNVWLSLNLKTCSSIEAIKWMDPPSEKVEIISVCSGVFRTATSASMLPSDDTPCKWISKVAMASAWPDVSQEGDTCQRRLSSWKLRSHYDEGHFLSLCACFAVHTVYLWTAFGTSGGQRVLSVPDRTRYIWSRTDNNSVSCSNRQRETGR